MTKAVVDRLEVVEVHEQDGQSALVTQRPGNRVANALDEEGSVGQARDGIVEGLVLELLLEGLALAHVAAVQDDAADVLVVQQIGVQHLEVAHAAVAVSQRALENLGLGLGVPRAACEHERETAPFAGLEQAVEAPPHDLLGLVSQHAFDRGALIDDRRLVIEHRDEVAGVLHERAETGLAATLVDLLGEGGALEGERDLGRERVEAAAQRP